MLGGAIQTYGFESSAPIREKLDMLMFLKKNGALMHPPAAPLACAADPAWVRALLKEGANPNDSSLSKLAPGFAWPSRSTPFYFLKDAPDRNKDNSPIVNFFRPMVWDSKVKRYVRKYSYRNVRECIFLLIDAGHDPNWPMGGPLGVACYQGDLELVKKLVTKGADVGAKKPQVWMGMTPLHRLALGDLKIHAEIAMYLRSKGARVDFKVNGLTPYQMALRKGHKRVAAALKP